MRAKELVIISGKGGTGKSSLVSAFASLAQNKVTVDCDVDAADLHLIFEPKIVKSKEFYCGKKAVIDSEKCLKCGLCEKLCRFGAINDFAINPLKCEGCGVCYFKCPNGAVELKQVKSGDWFESDTRFGKLVHAKLDIAQENSGKLVTEIRNHARALAKTINADLILTDGSPGVGCPVIASISGASFVVIVTEPTLSGLHDAKRVIELTRHFHVKAGLCINKYDINPEVSKTIEEFCAEIDIQLFGKIPYSKDFTKAMIERKSIVEYASDGEITKNIKNIWKKIKESTD